MTKARTAKLLRDVEQLEAVSRYLVAALSHLKLVQTVKTPEGEQPQSFVDPTMFSRLDVLKRGFFGRLQWLLSGK